MLTSFDSHRTVATPATSEVANGKIRSDTGYFYQMSFRAQLGLLEKK
jgi:hypothetical protein